ncbi:MAG: hypothetical protein MJZ03_02045 [archaeon]|nr:hypothetical protein [archaeon]
MNDSSDERIQMQIDALKAEVKTLKEFVKALYNMIADDDCDDEYMGGAGRKFNT